MHDSLIFDSTGQRPTTVSKKDSDTGVFLLILKHFEEHLSVAVTIYERDYNLFMLLIHSMKFPSPEVAL